MTLAMASRLTVRNVVAGVAFAAAAATLFVLGDDSDGALAFFLAWLALHVVYGAVAGSFWALLVVVVGPPPFVAVVGASGDETPLWLQAAATELFYGVPFAFMGVVARRLREARRPPDETSTELPERGPREGSPQ
ncbi:hypothetical protein BH18ACT13_BH18ACT13_21320 [soil metagenome]